MFFYVYDAAEDHKDIIQRGLRTRRAEFRKVLLQVRGVLRFLPEEGSSGSADLKVALVFSSDVVRSGRI